MLGQNIIGWDGKSRQYLPQQNNYKDYFQTGFTISNSLALDASTKNSSIRFSVADVRTREIIENSSLKELNLVKPKL